MGKLKGISETVLEKIESLYSLEYIKGMRNVRKNHIIAFVFLLITAAGFVLLISVQNEKQYVDYMFYYMFILIGSAAILLLPRIWYVISSKRLIKFKVVICHIFTSFTVIIAIPIIIIAVILRLCGFIKAIQYMEIFALSLFMTLILSIIGLVLSAKFITLYPKINQIAVLLLIAFIFARILISLMIKLMFYMEKRRQCKHLKLRCASEVEIITKNNQLMIDHKELKKEVNILIYGLIALSTGVISLVNWNMISTEPIVKALNDGMLTALALYTAIEAIGDKWRDRMGVE